jgi:hypothetical protein
LLTLGAAEVKFFGGHGASSSCGPTQFCCVK